MKRIIALFSLFLFFSAGAYEYSQDDIQRFSAYYSNGMEYLKSGQYSSAIVDFKKVMRFSPYDKTTQDALVNAYYARGEYFNNTTKEYKKALNDYKSAYFYAKYWGTTPSSSTLSLANNAINEIKNLEKKLSIAQSDQDRAQSAKVARAQGDLAASGYDFQQLKSGQYKESAYDNLANIYKNLNNTALAMEYIKTAIDINPKNPKLHFSYGVMLDEANNYEASIEQYNKALEYGDKSPELLEILENKWTQNIVNNPTNAQGYINLGAIYQKQGNFDQAKVQYIKATQLNPSDDVAYFNLASLYIQQNNYQSAISVYNQILERSPKNIDALEYKADALKKISKYDEALKQYDLILAIDPDNNDAKNNQEDIVLNHFSGEKLQNYMMQKALKFPNSYEDQFNYAFELHKNNNYNTAIDYYKKAMAINPSKQETYLNIAQIYIEQKKYDDAAKILQQGLLVLPSDQKLSAYLNETRSYLESTQYDTATKLFEQKRYNDAIKAYLKIQNQTPEVKLAIASSYWELNDYNSANKYYLDILSKDPNNLDVLVNSAYAYYSLNDFNNAKTTANKVLSLDKNNKEAQDIIASIADSEISNLLNDAIAQYEKGDYNSAISVANKVLNKRPDDEYALYYKGLSYDELNKHNEAIKIYKLLIQKHPEFISAYYSLAVALDNSENYQEAVNNYEKFISLNKQKDDMSTFSQSRIKELKDYLNQVNAAKK